MTCQKVSKSKALVALGRGTDGRSFEAAPKGIDVGEEATRNMKGKKELGYGTDRICIRVENDPKSLSCSHPTSKGRGEHHSQLVNGRLGLNAGLMTWFCLQTLPYIKCSLVMMKRAGGPERGSEPDQEDQREGLSPDQEDQREGLSPDQEDQREGSEPDQEDQSEGLSPDQEDQREGLSPTRRTRGEGLSPTRRTRETGLSPTRRTERGSEARPGDQREGLSPTRRTRERV
ncbi:unnamed protein product [Arctogadus glacialis]